MINRRTFIKSVLAATAAVSSLGKAKTVKTVSSSTSTTTSTATTCTPCYTNFDNFIQYNGMTFYAKDDVVKYCNDAWWCSNVKDWNGTTLYPFSGKFKNWKTHNGKLYWIGDDWMAFEINANPHIKPITFTLVSKESIHND